MGDPLDVAIDADTFDRLPWPPGTTWYGTPGRTVTVALVLEPDADDVAEVPAHHREFLHFRACSTLRHLDTVAAVALPAAGWPYPYADPRD